jgi:hypothetical protein
MNTSKYPKDIASAVRSELKRRKVEPFSENILVNLFETMFFASIRTEEAEPILFNIVYLDPNNPDPKPPKRLVRDRWGVVKFSKQINFNIPNILKLAKASDPRSSSLAIYHNNHNQLFIWGLIDQGNRYHDYVNYESEEVPERPGIFQASIEGPGFLVAYIEYQKIAELRINHLIRRTVDIFSKGPIKDALEQGVKQHLELVEDAVDEEAYNIRDSWNKSLTKYWFATICRILLRIKSYKHGGALLISKSPTKSRLNIKYPILYNRLKDSLVQRGIKLIEMSNASDQIYALLKDDYPEEIPTDLYLDENLSTSEFNSIRSEIDGSLWFISLLSRVDGLVLMNEDLSVCGFGVEINTSKRPEKVYLASKQTPLESNLKEVDYNHFGTRHRSMMRYCWKYPGSVGFVISQDGDVRAMINYEDKLIIWDNIRLQAYTFIKRKLLKRRKKLL